MLDFSKFKKVAEDKKTATMKHEGGHTITVALKALSPVQREAMKRLPLYEGGEAKLKEKAKDKVAHYDEGTPDAPVSSDDSDADQKPPVTVNVNQAPQPQSAAATQAATNVPVQQPALNTANPPVNLPNGSTNPTGAMQMGQEAASNQEKIDAAKAQAMVPVEQARIQAAQQQAQRDQDNVNALSTHADNLAANLKNINPNAAWDNMSDPKKVSTALGLFLGGLSVPFHGTNFAQDTLNKSLDRDVQAQIQNNENQKTIFGAYNTLYGNQVIASKMARASMADIYTDQASKIAQQLGTPQAFVNLQKLKSDLAVSKAKDIRDAAVNFNALPNFSGNAGGNGQSTSAGTGTPSSSGIQNVNQQVPLPNGQMASPEKANEFNVFTPQGEAIANSILSNPQYHPEVGPEQRSAIKEQMANASIADKNIRRLTDEKIFEQTVKDVQKAGPIGRALRNLSPHAIGAAGAATGAGIAGATGAGAGGAEKAGVLGGILGEGLGHMIPSTESNRQVETDRGRLQGIISAALGNRGDQFVQEAMTRFMPEYGDSKELAHDKLRGLKEYIMDHVQTNALKDKGITYR
jgi:hypothetical protein